ncbi:ABC transporter substrate-binding protein [Phytohabitans kaempferiae]|uniref:ABC transporter substrate-binding protein n=1 Tax=Phytohabitans kaempferiae TaxID=1620943 RepID=A0ABV6LXY2_9ACTN
MRVRRLHAAVLVPILALGVLAGCGSDDEEPPGGTTGPKTLEVGYIPGASLAPAFIADALGCYAEQELQIKFQPINNPADAIAFLANGRIHAYVGSPSAGLFNQVSRGANLKMVASLGSINTPAGEDPPSALFGGSGIGTVQDLRGKRVAVLGSVGTATSYLLGKSLATGGLTFADVELVPLAVADMVPALKNGSIAGAMLIAPYTQQAVEQGAGKAIVDSKQAYGTSTTAGVIYGDDLLKDDRATGVKYLTAVACGAKRMQGDWREDAEVVKALATFMKVPDTTISGGGLYVFDPTLTVNEDTLTEMQEMFLAVKGTLTYTEVVPAANLVDDEIRRQAVGA